MIKKMQTITLLVSLFVAQQAHAALSTIFLGSGLAVASAGLSCYSGLASLRLYHERKKMETDLEETGAKIKIHQEFVGNSTVRKRSAECPPDWPDSQKIEMNRLVKKIENARRAETGHAVIAGGLGYLSLVGIAVIVNSVLSRSNVAQ